MASVLIDLGTRKVHVDLDIAHDVIHASHAKDGRPALLWGKVNGQYKSRRAPLDSSLAIHHHDLLPFGDTAVTRDSQAKASRWWHSGHLRTAMPGMLPRGPLPLPHATR
jgi:hypothetical protein